MRCTVGRTMRMSDGSKKPAHSRGRQAGSARVGAALAALSVLVFVVWVVYGFELFEISPVFPEESRSPRQASFVGVHQIAHQSVVLLGRTEANAAVNDLKNVHGGLNIEGPLFGPAAFNPQCQRSLLWSVSNSSPKIVAEVAYFQSLANCDDSTQCVSNVVNRIAKLILATFTIPNETGPSNFHTWPMRSHECVPRELHAIFGGSGGSSGNNKCANRLALATLGGSVCILSETPGFGPKAERVPSKRGGNDKDTDRESREDGVMLMLKEKPNLNQAVDSEDYKRARKSGIVFFSILAVLFVILYSIFGCNDERKIVIDENNTKGNGK